MAGNDHRRDPGWPKTATAVGSRPHPSRVFGRHGPCFLCAACDLLEQVKSRQFVQTPPFRVCSYGSTGARLVQVTHVPRTSDVMPPAGPEEPGALRGHESGRRRRCRHPAPLERREPRREPVRRRPGKISVLAGGFMHWLRLEWTMILLIVFPLSSINCRHRGDPASPVSLFDGTGTSRTRNVAVGTVRRSIDASEPMWFVEEGSPGLRGRAPWLGRHEAGHASLGESMPSLSNSP
jgi:hypothetical protein